jgi:ribulose-phosphate 3-epimerase
MSLRVAPSIIAGDQSRLGEEVRAIEAAGADLVHLDVMDGHFVPNLTIGPGVVKDLRRHSTLPFDCHLMLSRPEPFLHAFAHAGADRITVHVEAEDPEGTLRAIRALGKAAGLAINPETPVARALPLLGLADVVLILTVHPGFYGQSMIPEALDKIAVVRDTARALGRAIVVQVDGGVAPGNAGRVARAGADEVVAGAAVFGAPDYRAAIEGLRRAGNGP